ncbi:MAG: glycosyltransferase family 39 protein, partial [Chloroflexi bacterium]|nr:glycosyltransferase family 39 protein [Chloroflexota bacterium]
MTLARRELRRSRDLLVLAGLLVLAALLRLPCLATRGTWDADQGHDMLVLRLLVRDGVVPLLGPPTSIGEFHHGAWYYYLLSPAAAVSAGESPLAVVGLIALAGIAAVGVTWWLARSIGGSAAGAAAGFAMAVSIAAIDESTFIWNPNLIPLASSLALAGAWQAWVTGRPRWWLLAAVGTAVTIQCHVLGVTLVPVVAGLFVADVRRRPSHDPARGSLARMGALGSAIIVLSYVPLVIHELTADFSELRAALDYLASGRGADSVAIPVRLGIVGLRVVSWPLSGLITSGFLPAVVSTAALIGLVAWRWRSPGTPARERVAVRWLGLGLVWTIVALSVAAPSLATVVPGLPNDHYHAFADPMVFVLVGLGLAALARGGPGA